jgi:hypothetical protein
MDITTKQLAKDLAQAGGTPEEKSLQFLHALSSAITFAISTNKDFHIKNFGRFVPSGVETKGSVSTFGEVASRVLGLPADVIGDMLVKSSGRTADTKWCGPRRSRSASPPPCPARWPSSRTTR